MMTSDPVSMPELRGLEQGEIDSVLRYVVRKHHVVVELMDDPDDDGNPRVRIHVEDQDSDKLGMVVQELMSGGTR